MEQLKEVDKRIEDLGTVLTRDGFPVLPSVFMEKETFESQIAVLQSKIKDNPTDQPLKFALHHLLLCHVGVDLQRRRAMLDDLIERRIGLLLQLHSIDRDAYPFTMDLGIAFARQKK
jgi:hypothetical protein